jgi:sugar (glycoside-pentoside-hexuronide) transporter
MEKNSKRKRTLPWLDNLGYSMGNFGSNLIFGMAGFYMVYFYTDVMGISAAIVSVLMLVARFWDAINDPIMGSFVDKTRTKMGKFRPYIIAGIVPCAIMYVLTYYTPNFSHTGKVIWAFATYIPLGMIVTSINIPYHAQTTIMSVDPIERAEIGAVSSITAILATLVVAAGTLPIVASFKTPQIGFVYITAIFGIVMIVSYYITFVVTKKYDRPQSTDKLEKTAANRFTFKEKMKVLTKNPPLLALMFGYLFVNTAQSIMAASAIYFFQYYIQKSKAVTSGFLGGFLILMMIGMMLVPYMSKKSGKQKLFQVSNFITAICLFCPLLVYLVFDRLDSTGFIMMSLFFMIGSFWSGPVVALIWGMIPDTVEYAELKVGIRSEGMIFAFLSFMMKAGLALGGVITAGTLAIINYVPNQEQPDTTLFGILCMFTLVPSVIRILANISMKYYSLSEEQFKEIVQILEQHRASQKSFFSLGVAEVTESGNSERKI